MAVWKNSVTCGGFKCVQMDPDKYPRAEGLAYSAYFPVGREPGRVTVLMFRRDVQQIDQTQPVTVVFAQEGVGGQSGGSNVTGGTLTFSGLYVSRAICVGGYAQADNAVYLVTLVDCRAIAKMSDSGNAQYNVRHEAHDLSSAPYLAGTINDVEPWTWQAMVDDLWDRCADVGDAPTLPFSPQGLPESYRFVGVGAWDALNDVIEKIGCVVVYNPLQEEFSIATLGDDEETLTPPQVYDADPLDGTIAESAEKVRVWFPVHLASYGQERDSELTNNWSVAGHSYSIDIETGLTAVEGTVHTIWDDNPRVLNELGVSMNDTALTARAEELANLYILDRSTAKNLKHLSGLNPLILPSGKIRSVMWRNWGDGWFTEWASHPGLPQQSASRPSIVTAENLRTPSLARRGLPVYPRLPNIVQVLHDTVTMGNSAQANAKSSQGNYFHKGKVNRYLNNLLAQTEDCWILFVDSFGSKLGNVNAVQGEYYGPARLSGITTATTIPEDEDEDEQTLTLPVYVVRGALVSAPQTLYYYASKAVKGFGPDVPAVGTACLDPTHLSGWAGAASVIGDESAVGIAFDDSEASPDTNGNFAVNKTGTYKLEISGGYRIRLGSSVGATINNLLVKCDVYCKRASGGTNDLLADVLGGTPIRDVQEFEWAESGDFVEIQLSTIGYAFLNSGDRLSFNWVLSSDSSINSNVRVALQYGGCPLVFFTYLQPENMFSKSTSF